MLQEVYRMWVTLIALMLLVSENNSNLIIKKL